LSQTKSCKRLDDGKHASCEICGEKCPVEAVQHLAPETLAFTAPVGVHW